MRKMFISHKLRGPATGGYPLTFHALVGCSTTELQRTFWNIYPEILILRIFKHGSLTIVVSFRLASFSTRLREGYPPSLAFFWLVTLVTHSLERKDCVTSRKNVCIEGKVRTTVYTAESILIKHVLWLFRVFVFPLVVLIPWTLLLVTE